MTFIFHVHSDSLTEMLHADLLSNEGIVQLASSWRFLLGLSSTIVSLCADSMKQRLEKKGVQAFDGSYLEHFGMLDERHRLVSNDNQTAIKKKSKDFDGATEFFFLSAALLHVSLYPMMRVENAFHQQYNKLFIILQDQEKQKSHVPPHLQNQSTAAVVTWFGFDSFMDDPECKPTSNCVTASGLLGILILTVIFHRDFKDDIVCADTITIRPYNHTSGRLALGATNALMYA